MLLPKPSRYMFPNFLLSPHLHKGPPLGWVDYTYIFYILYTIVLFFFHSFHFRELLTHESGTIGLSRAILTFNAVGSLPWMGNIDHQSQVARTRIYCSCIGIYPPLFTARVYSQNIPRLLELRQHNWHVRTASLTPRQQTDSIQLVHVNGLVFSLL